VTWQTESRASTTGSGQHGGRFQKPTFLWPDISKKQFPYQGPASNGSPLFFFFIFGVAVGTSVFCLSNFFEVEDLELNGGHAYFGCGTNGTYCGLILQAVAVEWRSGEILHLFAVQAGLGAVALLLLQPWKGWSERWRTSSDVKRPLAIASGLQCGYLHAWPGGPNVSAACKSLKINESKKNQKARIGQSDGQGILAGLQPAIRKNIFQKRFEKHAATNMRSAGNGD